LISNTYNNFDANPTVAYPLLILSRDGKDATTYSSEAAFGVSRYENSGLNARTQLDINLAQGSSLDTTVMSLRGNGNVGIGTASPTVKLAVADTTGSCLIRAFGNASGTTVTGQLGASSSALVAVGAVSNHPLVFTTNDAEQMRITTGGLVLVGTSSASTQRLTLYGATNQWGVGPSTSSDTFSILNGGGAGVALTWGATSWSGVSDENLKNITGEINNGISKVCSLRAAEFTWKSDEKNKPQVGLIAQDVQKVLPQAISEDASGSLSVRYTETIPLLVAAIKEQQALIENLTTRLNALEGK
jgi:uncharacterized protein YaiE (UPF0345 family)